MKTQEQQKTYTFGASVFLLVSAILVTIYAILFQSFY